MTLEKLYESYQIGMYADRRIILCNYQTQEGYEINNEAEFSNLVDKFQDRPLIIMNQAEGEDFWYFEYFELEKAEPSIAVIHHPHLLNAYWKEAPDRIVDIAPENTHIYRIISVDYGALLKEEIIEFPTEISDKIWALLKKRFPKALFKNVKNSESSWSIVFGNTNRFKAVEPFSFKIFPLDSLYPSLKRPTIKNVSQKLWKEVKALTKNEITKITSV